MGNILGICFALQLLVNPTGGVGVVIDGCPPRLEISAEETKWN
jgi:chorismate synthase